MTDKQAPARQVATPLSQRHHMTIPWKDFIRNEDVPAKRASIQERT